MLLASWHTFFYLFTIFLCLVPIVGFIALIIAWLLHKEAPNPAENFDQLWLVINMQVNELVKEHTVEDPYMKRHRLLLAHNAELQAKAARKKVTDAAWYQRNKQRHKDSAKARYLKKKAVLSGLGDSPLEQQPNT